MHSFKKSALAIGLLAGATALAGCKHATQFDETGGVKITRSSCPAIAVPAYTGDVTIFDPPASREAKAIDVVGAITDLHGGCTQQGDMLATTATFQVQARRSSGGAARQVILPYFVTVMRGGTVIVSKQLGQAVLNFAPGELRATVNGNVSANVSVAAASLSDKVLARLNKRRKAGDADASIDPMADPEIKAAVSRASFELLVGFQLTQDQLAYNATR